MTTTEQSKKCILGILQELGSVSTQTILENTHLFPDLCSGCKSGSNVMMAAMKLLKEGKIDRIVGKGGFVWQLK